MAEYDVFLSYNSADQESVEIIAQRLREEAKLHPFLDRWHLVPGEPWQEAIEEALDACQTVDVFLGPPGICLDAGTEPKRQPEHPLSPA